MYSLPTLVTFSLPPIEVKGNDLIVGGVQLPFKQRVVVTDLNYKFDISEILNDGKAVSPILGMGAQPAIKGNAVAITVRSLFYKDYVDGQFIGRVAGGTTIQEYSTTFTADNDMIVAAEDVFEADGETIKFHAGQYLGKKSVVKPEDFNAPLFNGDNTVAVPAGKFYGVKPMQEGEFFDRLAKMKPLILANFIESFITLNIDRVQP
jgi:hypothetical protein